MSKPKVVLFEKTNLDISSLSRYGEVVYLFEGTSRPALFDRRVALTIKHRIKELDIKPTDFFAVTGKMVPVVLTVKLNYFQKLLAFDSKSGKYRCVYA